MATYSLVTRESKGSKLTIEDMDGNLLYLQQLAMMGVTSSGATCPQGPQGPAGNDGIDGNTGVQGANGRDGDIYYATFSYYLTIPDVGYVLELSALPNLAYSSGQSVVIFNEEDSFWVDDDYDEDSTLSSKVEGEVEYYDATSGTMSIIVTYAQQIGTTGSFWYINLIGERGYSDKYVATSNTYFAIPDVENVVELTTQQFLAYTPGQWIVVYNNTGGFYVDYDYDDDDGPSGIFFGQVETYDPLTGTMSIVAEASTGVGLTFSSWFLNLSGNMGPQGPSSSAGSVGAAGPQGSIQFNSSSNLSGTSSLVWNNQYLSILSGIDNEDGLHVSSTSNGQYFFIANAGEVSSVGTWNGSYASTNMKGQWFSFETPGLTDSSLKVANTSYVSSVISSLTSSYVGEDMEVNTLQVDKNLIANNITYPYSSTYSTITSASASVNDLTFNGVYSGSTSATYSIQIFDLNKSVLLVEATSIPFIQGEIIRGTISGSTASLIALISGGENILAIDQDAGIFSADEGQLHSITGLSSGAAASYDSPRSSDLFTWNEIGGSASSGIGICQVSIFNYSTNIGNEISVYFSNPTGHSIGDTWIYNILPFSTSPLTVNADNIEALKVNGDGSINLNSVKYNFPNSQATNDSVLTNDGNGNLNWTTAIRQVIPYQRVVPTEGGSYSIPSGYSVALNLNAFGTLNNYTLGMPTNPIDGEVVNICIFNSDIYNWTIDNLNFTYSNSQLMDNASPTNSIWPNRSCSFIWINTDSTWARLS